jgi:ribokinase
MIVVFGSLNVDLVLPVKSLPRPGETVLGRSYSIVGGGKGANQALAARRAGGNVRMIGAVGRDGFAGIALAELAGAGVDLSGVARQPAPTGCAFICVDRVGENHIAVASGANLKPRERQVGDDLLGPESLVVMQMEVPPAQNWALIARARKRGARLLLNVAPAGALPAAALRALDWLVVNEIEVLALAQGLGRGSADPRAAGAAVAAAAGVAVVVTLGAQGAVAFTGSEAWQIGALPIKPVDSTAAGDAFVGAFAAAIDRGTALPGALRFGSVAAGLACLVAGAQPSLPSLKAIEQRLCDLPPARKIKQGRG